MKITEPPASRNVRIRRKRLPASVADSTAVGSSIRMSFGCRAKALASSIICQSDTGRSLSRARTGAAEPSSASRSFARISIALRSVKGPRVISRPRKTFSDTVRCGARQNSWCTITMPARSAACSVSGAGMPSSSIVPEDGGASPAAMRMRVDLPAPFSPTSASTSPGLTTRSIPLSTGTMP
ncbi:MAG: hypothetical protein BGO06_06560 [Shinella sp. 65-6]|nr:MAG: hypothetical protein BGO06_06560 [Shinella sp. 65-6]